MDLHVLHLLLLLLLSSSTAAAVTNLTPEQQLLAGEVGGSVDFCFEPGFDYYGSDIHEVDHVYSPRQCQRLCAYHPTCVFFTWGAADPAKNR